MSEIPPSIAATIRAVADQEIAARLAVAPQSDASDCEHTPFTFWKYQREDLARAVLHDGAIISWEPGMGKTMCLFALPWMKRARRALLVVPGGLHDQVIREGKEKFGIEVRRLSSQEDFYRYQLWDTAPDFSGRPIYYITDYHALGRNGGDEWAARYDKGKDTLIEVNDTVRRRRFRILARLFGLDEASARPKFHGIPADKRHTADPLTMLGIDKSDASDSEKIAITFIEQIRRVHPTVHPGDDTMYDEATTLAKAYHHILTGSPYHQESNPFGDKIKGIMTQLKSDLAEIGSQIKAIEEGIGIEKNGIKCLFTPTLSTLCQGHDTFDIVICDEGVRLKSGDTFIAEGVLNLQPKYRYVLTGTPIKNTLPDLFWLAHWVCGSPENGNARFPYGKEKRAKFADEFMGTEVNHTKAAAAAARPGASRQRTFQKKVNQVCNVHRLWKILAPIIIRRRKEDVADEMVKKTIVPIRIAPGTAQREVIGFHLAHTPPGKTLLARRGAQLQKLRQAALCPASENLRRSQIGDEGEAIDCAHSVSHTDMTPKVAATMKLTADLLEQGEQLVVFSPFGEFSSTIERLCKEAGISACRLDGKVSPKRRGILARQFKQGHFSVLIAGIQSMGEGHSFECCSNLVLPSISWAYDENAQAIERVHRMTSKKPVTIYAMVTEGSIDERLTQIFQEKGDVSNLAIDGKLIIEHKKEVSITELLEGAAADYNAQSESISEASILQQWNDHLCRRLRHAQQTFRTIRAARAAAEVTAIDTARAAAPVAPAPAPAPAIQSDASDSDDLAAITAMFTTAIDQQQAEIDRIAASILAMFDEVA